MLNQQQAMLLSQFLGKDISPYILMFNQFKEATGLALNHEQKVFVTRFLKHGMPFLYSDKGKKAIQSLVDEWMKYEEENLQKTTPPVVNKPQI